MHGEELRLPPKIADRLELLGIVIGEMHYVRGARGVIVGDQDRVAVGVALHGGVHADGAACAGPVLHNDLPADGLRQALADRARDEVDGASRGKRNDEPDHLMRIGLCPDCRRHKQAGAEYRLRRCTFEEGPPFDLIHRTARLFVMGCSSWKGTSVTSTLFRLHSPDERLPLATSGYRTFTYLRSTRGRGSPANTLPCLSTVPNSGPLPVVVAGLPPWSRMKCFTQPFWASPILMPCSKPGLSTLSDSESNT